MASASNSRFYRLFQTVACLGGAGLIIAGLVLPDYQFVGYGGVILVHGLVATFMIWLDTRRLARQGSGS